MPEEKRPVGRPSGLTDEVIEKAGKLYELGATDMEVADFFGVTVRTVHRWKLESDKFCHSMDAAKQAADDRVEKSLYHRALGYEHEEVDIRVVGGEIIQTPIRKYYPPDTTAGVFWLKNRRPDKWREMKAVELTGKDGGAVEANLSVRFVKPDAG